MLYDVVIIFPVLYSENTTPYIALDKRDIQIIFYFMKTYLANSH